MIWPACVRIPPPVLRGINDIPCSVKETIPAVHKDLVIRSRRIGTAEDFNAIRQVTGNTVKGYRRSGVLLHTNAITAIPPDRVPYNHRRGAIYTDAVGRAIGYFIVFCKDIGQIKEDGPAPVAAGISYPDIIHPGGALKE